MHLTTAPTPTHHSKWTDRSVCLHDVQRTAKYQAHPNRSSAAKSTHRHTQCCTRHATKAAGSGQPVKTDQLLPAPAITWRQASKQRDKLANRQPMWLLEAAQQASKQASRQASKQTSKQTGNQLSNQPSKQESRQAGTAASTQASS